MLLEEIKAEETSTNIQQVKLYQYCLYHANRLVLFVVS